MSKQLTIIREVKKQQEDGLSNGNHNIYNLDENDLKNQLKRFDKMIQQTKLKNYSNKVDYLQAHRYSIPGLDLSHTQDQSMKNHYDKHIYMHGSQFNAQHLQNYLKYSKYSNMSNYQSNTILQNQPELSIIHNDYQIDDHTSSRSSLQLTSTKIEDITQINNHLVPKNDKLNQSKDKTQINASFFFKNKNYRDSIANETKFQIRNYDMNNMNSLNIIDHRQRQQIVKNQKQLQKNGYYNQYYSQRKIDFDQDKLNFNKDTAFMQKQEYQTLKQEREKFKQWLQDTRNKNKRLKLLQNRYQTGIIGLENPMVDDSVYKNSNIYQINQQQINKKHNNFKCFRKYWDSDPNLLVQSCKTIHDKLSQDWKHKKRVNEEYLEQRNNTSNLIVSTERSSQLKQKIIPTQISKVQFY